MIYLFFVILSKNGRNEACWFEFVGKEKNVNNIYEARQKEHDLKYK